MSIGKRRKCELQNGDAVEWSVSLDGGEIYDGVFVVQRGQAGVKDSVSGNIHWLEDCQQMWVGCDYEATLHRKLFNPVLKRKGRNKIYIWKVAQ